MGLSRVNAFLQFSYILLENDLKPMCYWPTFQIIPASGPYGRGCLNPGFTPFPTLHPTPNLRLSQGVNPT